VVTTSETEARGGGRAFAAAYLHRRYAILFYSLLLTIAVGPALKAFRLETGLIEVLLAANVLVAVLPVGAGGARRILLGALGIAVAEWVVAVWLQQPALSRLGLGLWAVVAMLATVGALRFGMRASVVDSEHLYAALSAYLLAGIFFGVVYFVLQRTWPGSLLIGSGIGTGEFSVVSGIYFSFVTLATLGYGDVVPQSEVARGFAIAEAVAGQFYLAVMVARLVSLYASEAARRRPS